MRDQPISTFTCDLSGIVESGLDFDTGDDLGDLPIGWSTVTISTRVPNPNYELVMDAKEAAAAGMLEQAGITDPDGEDAAIVTLMTDAQFAPLMENVTPFLIEDTEIYVHPDYLGELIKALGLEGEIELPDFGEAAATPEAVFAPISDPIPAEVEEDEDEDEDEDDEGDEDDEDDEIEEAKAAAG